MPLPKNNKLLPFARALRKEMTPQERKLWYLYLRRYPVKIYRQRIIDSYIADFYCHAARLVIEIDGSQHYTKEGDMYDEQRSRALSDLGLAVVRFSNNEVDTQFSFVCGKIEKLIKERIKGERNDQL